MELTNANKQSKFNLNRKLSLHKKKVVLLIEQNENKRHAIQNYLQINGFHVFTESSAFKAIQDIKRLHPDMVLCNEKMTELSGYDIYNSIQKESQTKDIPFIFLSDFNLFNNPADPFIDDHQINLKYPSLIFHINKRLSQADLLKKEDYFFTKYRNVLGLL